MKKKFEHKERKGLPGGPNEMFTYVTSVFDIYQAPSNIEGEGMFAGKPFKKGDLIGLAHSNGQPASQLGRMHNHDENSPTMISKKSGNDRFVFAAKDLQPGDELTTNYRMQPELEQPEDFQYGGSVMAPSRKGVRKNPDGSESTHLMATETFDGKNWFSFPTLFQDPDGTWIDMSDRPWQEAYEEAKKRGEVIEFGTDKEAAIKFGEGSWKLPKAQEGNGEIISLSPSNPRYAEYYNRLNDDVVLADMTGKTAGRIILDEVDVVANKPKLSEFNFQPPASVQDQIARQTPFKFSPEGIAADKSYQEYQDYIKSLPYDQRPGYIQPTISEYVPPSTGKWLWNKLSHPMSTLGYIVRGEDMPDMIGRENAIDYAVDVINPATYINTVGDIGESISEGDIVGAGLDAVTLLPAVPTAAKQVKKAIPAIKSTTRNIPAKINPKYYNPKTTATGNPDIMYREVGKDAYDDLVNSGFLRTQAEITDNPIMGLLETQKEIKDVLRFNKEARPFQYRHPTDFRAPFFSRGKTTTIKDGGADYLIQTRPDKVTPDDFFNAQWNILHGKQPPVVGGFGIMDPMKRSADNFDVFKKSWWHGYKPVKQDGGEASKIAAQQIAAQQATGYRPQATISQYEEPAWYEKAADYLASPMTSLGYLVRGEDLPDRIPINAENRNTYDMAFDIINPAAWAAYAESADKNLEEGNYLAAGLDAMGAIPVIPSSLSQGRNVIKVGSKSSPQLYKKSYRPLDRMLDMEGASSFVTEKPMTFTHVSRNPALTLDDIKTTEAFTVGKRPKGGKRAIRDVAAGVSDPRNAPAGFYTISPEEGVRATLAGYATPGSGAYRYSFEMPAGLRVLDFPGGTSVMSTGNLQEALDMGYDVIRGNDMGVGVEFLPLNKSKMSGFSGEPIKQYGGSLPKAQNGVEETSWTDYINPMNWGVTNRDDDGNFKQAFRAARIAGDDEFMWHGTRYNTELAPTPEEPKEEKLFYNKDILKGLSEEQTARRQSLLNAANAVASAQGDDDNLRKLLVMSAVMENTLGADPKAYGRDYTRSPMSIDDVAYDDLFKIREGARGYTAQQKKNASWLEGLGINPSEIDSLLRADDPMAAMATARLVYGRAPEALPSGDDPDALYNYYLKYYNKGGVDKYGGAEAHRKKFNDYYNQIYREFGGETNQLKIYKDYVHGVYDGTEMEKSAEKIYDKLNRVYYKEAKKQGMRVPNYIMTNVIKQIDN